MQIESSLQGVYKPNPWAIRLIPVLNESDAVSGDSGRLIVDERLDVITARVLGGCDARRRGRSSSAKS
jgi:hypothetical protein